MADNKPRNVTEYLKQLPPDKRKVISTIRKTILKHLPKGYKESISWHMIAYCIPLTQYPDTYNRQPLGYLAVAVQKNYFALYMMGVYMDKAQETALKDGFKKAGKRLNMGKSCLRFRALEDVAWTVVGKVIASTPPKRLIALYERNRRP
jgi:hypothetical protein